MKVPDLIAFYNNQNQLAVQAASQTAANQTSANLQDARLAQEKQLEHYRQQMENMRQARAQSSSNDLVTKQIEAKKQENILSQTFEGSQNAAKQDFSKELQAMQEAGANQRTTQQITAEAPLRAAQTAEITAKTAETGQVTPKDLIDTYVALQKEPDTGGFLGMGQDEQTKRRKAILSSLETQLGKFGIDPTTNPDVIAAKAPEVAAKAEALTKEKDPFGLQQAKVDLLRTRWASFKAKVANGIIPPENVAKGVAMMRDLAKSYGVDPASFDA